MIKFLLLVFCNNFMIDLIYKLIIIGNFNEIKFSKCAKISIKIKNCENLLQLRKQYRIG